MSITNSNILAALAERETLQAESLALQGRARKVQDLLEAARVDQGALAALDATDAAAMTAWAAAGCKGDAPAADSKARDAAGNARAAAAESTLVAIQAEHQAISERLTPVNAAVHAATATHLVDLNLKQHAAMRELEDRLEVLRHLGAATWRAAQKCDAGIAGRGAEAAEAERVEWLNVRQATVRAALEQAWVEIASTIPE